MPLDLTAVGPSIEPGHSEALQRAVANQLVAQVEEVVLASAELVEESLEAVSAAFALRDLPARRREATVLHPSFRYWLQAMRRSSRAGQEAQRQHFIRHIFDFVWPAQAAEGQLNRLWPVWTDEGGGLRCPPLGRWVELGEAYASLRIEIAPFSDGVQLQCPDGLRVRIPRDDLVGEVIDPPPTIEEHGYQIRRFPRLLDGQVEISTRDPWLRVQLTGTNQRTDGTHFFGASKDLYRDYSDFSTIDTGLRLLGAYWHDQVDDLAKFSRVIVPLDVKSSASSNTAFTVSSRQGAIYIGPATPVATVEMLIHENAHVKLRQIQFIDTLLENPLDDTLRIAVPWRPDPRPIPGIFEGLFVFTHVAEFYRRWLRSDGGAYQQDRFRTLVRDLRHAINSLGPNARFTKEGAQFFQSMTRWVDDLDRSASALRSSRLSTIRAQL